MLQNTDDNVFSDDEGKFNCVDWTIYRIWFLFADMPSSPRTKKEKKERREKEKKEKEKK